MHPGVGMSRGIVSLPRKVEERGKAMHQEPVGQEYA